MLDVVETLATLEVPIISVGEEEIRGECPFHEENGGKKGSQGDWYINSGTGMHQCWSCGYKGGLEKLVGDLLQLNYREASKWLFDNQLTTLTMADLENRRDKQRRKATDAYKDTVTEAHLHMFTEVPQGRLDKRNIDKDIANTYGIRWNKGAKSWIIPIRDGKGVLLGYQEKMPNITMNRPKGLSTGSSLFGLGMVEGVKELIVVESPLDVLRIASAKIKGAVATYGAGISKEQVRAISKYRSVLLALDNDSAGRNARDKLVEELNSTHKIRLWSYKGTKGEGIGRRAKDPGDMTDEQIVKAYETSPTYLQLIMRKKLS